MADKVLRMSVNDAALARGTAAGVGALAAADARNCGARLA
jgi:hypothetical protein